MQLGNFYGNRPDMACPFPGQAGPSSTSSALDQGKVQVNWLVDWLGVHFKGFSSELMGVAMVLSQVGFSSLIQTQTNVQERSPLAVIGTMPDILLLGCFVDCCLLRRLSARSSTAL